MASTKTAPLQTPEVTATLDRLAGLRHVTVSDDTRAALIAGARIAAALRVADARVRDADHALRAARDAVPLTDDPEAAVQAVSAALAVCRAAQEARDAVAGVPVPPVPDDDAQTALRAVESVLRRSLVTEAPAEPATDEERSAWQVWPQYAVAADNAWSAFRQAERGGLLPDRLAVLDDLLDQAAELDRLAEAVRDLPQAVLPHRPMPWRPAALLVNHQ